MTSPDPLDDTRADYERLETELVAQDRDASRVATADIDERSAGRLVDELIEDDMVRPVADQRVLVHEPSSKPFESITQLAVFHHGWQAATDADAEDDRCNRRSLGVPSAIHRPVQRWARRIPGEKTNG